MSAPNASPAEQHTATELCTLLAPLSVGDRIEDSPPLHEFLDSLSFFVQEQLRGTYSYWKGESLDGITPWSCTKIGDRAAEVLGMCILLGDQGGETPLHARLRHSAHGHCIDWMECRVGTPGPGSGFLARLPGTSDKLIFSIAQDPDEVTWMYTVTYHGGCVA